MGLKSYIVFGLILIIGISSYIYVMITPVEYDLELLGIHINLPIAVWFAIPPLILYIATIIHMIFYGTLGFFRLKKIRNDAEKFLENEKRALLGKKIDDNNYKSEIFKLPGKILPLLNIDPKRYSGYRVFDDDIADIMEIKQKVYNGEVVDLSKFNLLPDNAIMIKNAENMLNQDKKYATTILKNCPDETLCKKATKVLTEYATLNELEKLHIKMDREILDILVSRIGKDGFSIPNSKLIEYAKELNFNKDDLLKLSKDLKDKLTPDERVQLADELLTAFPDTAGEAYLYTMFDLQLMDKAREYLDNSSKKEYTKFKHLLFLKDSGKNFDINLFV